MGVEVSWDQTRPLPDVIHGVEHIGLNMITWLRRRRQPRGVVLMGLVEHQAVKFWWPCGSRGDERRPVPQRE